MAKQHQRLRRQFTAISRTVPGVRGLIDGLVDGKLRRLRIPLAMALILGSFLWFLPVLGLWMLPLGLLVLALDIPAMQPGISAAVIRFRRRFRKWFSRRTGK